MERKELEKDILNEQTTIFKQGEKNYNLLRAASIMICGQTVSLQDKKCLSMYLSIINSNNFFSDLLKKLKYDKGLPNFSSGDINNYHYEEEFRRFINPFESDIVILVLYLLDNPVIKLLNEKRGYSNLMIKLAVYDYFCQTMQYSKENNKSLKIVKKA